MGCRSSSQSRSAVWPSELLIAFHSKKAVNGNDAAPLEVSLAERRRGRNRLGLGIDRLASALLSSNTDQPQRKASRDTLLGVVIAPDDDKAWLALFQHGAKL
jgi:hypothetical protein